VHGPAGVGQPEREHEGLGAFVGQVHPRLAEVDLRVHAGLVVADHESRRRCRPCRLGDLLPTPVHVVPHRRVGDAGTGPLLKPAQDPFHGVPLLRRSIQVVEQPLIDCPLERLQPWRMPSRRPTRSGHGRTQCLAYQPAVDPVLARQRADRQPLLPRVPADQQEQFFLRGRHPASPPHGDLPRASQPQLQSGASSSRNNPRTLPRAPPVGPGPERRGHFRPLMPHMSTTRRVSCSSSHRAPSAPSRRTFIATATAAGGGVVAGGLITVRPRLPPRRRLPPSGRGSLTGRGHLVQPATHQARPTPPSPTTTT